MTQFTPPSISLESLSTELPSAWDVMPVGEAQLQTQSACPLVLVPGKPTDLLLRSRNNGEQRLQLSLSIQGNFPARWLKSIAGERSQTTWHQRISGEATEIIWTQPLEPRLELREVLSFEIESEFFEYQQALANRKKLELKYQGELYLYATLAGESERRLAGYQVVEFYVRPDVTYTDFLPEIYQRSDFVSRFITIFEQAFDPTVQILDDFWAYLDPLTAPKALIPFLAEWVAWPLNPNWTLRQQRWLIRHAIELYQWRGTHYGLQLALSLVTGLPNDDDHIMIREDHQADFVIGDITLQDEPTLGGGRVFHFAVSLHPDSSEAYAAIDEGMVRAVIEQEKPAFCTYDLTMTAPTAQAS